MTATDEPFHLINTATTHVVLPARLSKIRKANDFPSVKLCWNSSEVLFSILISFDKHKKWFADRIPTRPPNGSMFLFNRTKFKDYRKDGYTWKKRTKTSTTREDHSKLRVLGIDCLHVLYTHSDIIPTFHRRLYWLTQNPDVVLVHYLNIVAEDQANAEAVYSYVTTQRKETILSEITSVYSGLPQQLRPSIQVAEESNSSCPPSPSASNSHKPNEKTFKICIKPAPKPAKQNVPVSSIQLGGAIQWLSMPHKGPMTYIGGTLNHINSQGVINSPCQISTWITPNSGPSVSPYVTTSGTVTSSISVPIGFRPGTGVAVPIPTPPMNILNTSISADSSQNSNAPLGTDSNRTSSHLSSSSLTNINPTFLVLAKPVPSPNANAPLKTASNGTSSNPPLTNINPTFLVSASTGPSQNANIPLGTDSNGVSSNPHPSSSTNINPTFLVSASTKPPQNTNTPLEADSNGTSSNPPQSSLTNINPTFLVSATLAAQDNKISNRQVDTLEGDQIIVSTSQALGSRDDPEGVTVTSSNTNSMRFLYVNNPTSNCEVSQSGVTPANGCPSNTVPPSQGSNQSASALSSTVAAEHSDVTSCVSSCDSVYSSSTSSITTHPSATAELGTSPSSDYGSFLSDAGTRSCSGSESLSDHCSYSNSLEGIFDGPFRVPAPVPPDSWQSQGFNTDKPSHSQAADNTRHTTNNALDSQHLVDLGFDVNELSPLEPFLDGMLSNYDLNSVFPEYFDSVSEVNGSEQQENSNGNQEILSTGLVTNAVSFKGKTISHTTATSTNYTPSYSMKDSQTQPSSDSMDGANTCSSDTVIMCQSPIMDVVMTTSDVTPPSEVHISSPPPDLDEYDKEDNENIVSPCPESTEVQISQSNSPTRSSQSSARSTSQTGFTPRVVPRSARITDYSPEWSYPEGRAKVLVTGEWSMTDMSYTCLFDGCSVEATLVQCGVLRCYCPPHDAGLVTLQVACNGFIVSNACVFEYRECDTPGGNTTRHEWLTMDEARFKLAMLDRLERLESSLALQPQTSTTHNSPYTDCTTFEDRIIRACRALFKSQPTQGSVTEFRKPYRGMSLLHLAAALGFTRLIRELKALKPTERSSPLRQEIDYTRKDEFSCTPLMWACGLGHKDVVCELLMTDMNTLLSPDARGRMPMQLARDRGYFEVVDCIEEFFTSSDSRQSALINGSVNEDDEDIADSAPRSPTTPVPSTPDYYSNTATSANNYHSNTATPVSSYHSNTPVSVGSQDTTYTDRACSPMAVEEDPHLIGVPLGHALVQVHAMINEAELEADLEVSHLQRITGRIQGQPSPVHEESDLLTSAGAWVSPGGCIRSFSSASSQSSPLTPSSRSSLSPGSPGKFLNSPHSSPSVAPDTKEFHEFLCTSKKLLEKNLSELTLTDHEQRELYQAALIIQEAYRSYKTRRQQREEEMKAAVLIQNHYRRYKQYAVLKKMTQAALIIQNQYRAYREHEQLKKRRRAAAIIQNHFRIYRRRRQSQKRRDEYKTKQQEARFMRQASNRSNNRL